jgi:L-amino acid N-acyltransferase YncA
MRRLVIGGIAPPNEALVTTDERFGFEKVPQFKEVGRRFNEWTDVGY